VSKELYFCRFEEADGLRFCVECCEGINCSNLGELPDKTRGCLGYNKTREEAGIAGVNPMRESCKNVYCWEGRVVNGIRMDSPKILKMTYGEIKKRPVGEYRMDTIVKQVLVNFKK
jgi:hypothetical protein